MKKYCAFLRGVNVNGKAMKMEDARGVFEKAGMTDVATVLASGNIVFRTDKPRGALRELLELALAGHYKAPVNLFVKSSDEVAAMLASAPFAEDADSHVYVFVCEPGFEKALLAEYEKIIPAENESAAVCGGFFYWQCAKGMTLDSGFSKILGRKDLKEKFTSRNINTIVKVSAKMS